MQVIVSLRNPGLRERHWPGHPEMEEQSLQATTLATARTLIGEAIDQSIQANQMKDGTSNGRDCWQL